MAGRSGRGVSSRGRRGRTWRYGQPRTPVELGLTDDQFVEAIVQAPTTRPGRYTILEHLALSPNQTAQRVSEFLHAVDGLFHGNSAAEAPRPESDHLRPTA